MLKQYKTEFLSTRCFYNLNKDILLSKKLQISLINCRKTDIKKYNYIYMKTREDLNINKTDLAKDLKKIISSTDNNSDFKKITKKILGYSISDNEIADVDKYSNYLLTKNVIIKYTQKYENFISYDGKAITRPDVLREYEVINYINFLDFMIPYNSDLEQTRYKSEDFMFMLYNLPYVFTTRFSVIDDDRKYRKFNCCNWLSKSLCNLYTLHHENDNINDLFLKKKNFNYFSQNLDVIIKTASKVEKIINDENDCELFKYIANTIYTAENCNDNRTSILLYTSILEAILTHKPDINRFNVEDSISKQFCLKTCIALERCNSDINIDRYSKICSLIYSVRSDITHGNVNNIDKIIKLFDKVYSKKEEFKNNKTTYNDVIETILNEVCFIVKEVLALYLNDNEYVNFLKNN